MPDVAVTDAAAAVGTSGKREVKGVSRLAALLTPVVNNGLDVAGAQVDPARGPDMAFLRVPALFLTGLEKPLAQPAGGKPYTLGYPGHGQSDKESGSTGLPQVRENGMERVNRRSGGAKHLIDNPYDVTAINRTMNRTA